VVLELAVVDPHETSLKIDTQVAGARRFGGTVSEVDGASDSRDRSTKVLSTTAPLVASKKGIWQGLPKRPN
jgi:hypothetical protein